MRDKDEKDPYRMRSILKDRISVVGIGNIKTNPSSLLTLNNDQDAGGLVFISNFENRANYEGSICFKAIKFSEHEGIRKLGLDLFNISTAEHIYRATRIISGTEEDQNFWDQYIDLETNKIDEPELFKQLLIKHTIDQVGSAHPEINVKNASNRYQFVNYFNELFECIKLTN